MTPDTPAPAGPPRPLVVVSLCGEFSEADAALVLEYVSAVYRELGRAGLCVLGGREMRTGEG